MGSSFTEKIKDQLGHTEWIDFLRKNISKMQMLLVERVHFKFLRADMLARTW